MFTCEQEQIKVSIADGEDVLLSGITAADKKDGDVTGTILLEKLSNMYEGNRRTATYAAFDSDNHITKMEREIIYKDYSSPKFELTGSLRFRTGENVNIDQIINAKDCLDGDLSAKVKLTMDSTISNRVPGVYQIVVEIYEAVRNEVQLNLKTYLVYQKKGSTLDYKSYLKSVITNNTEYFFEGVTPEQSENVAMGESSVAPRYVTVESNVNINKKGVYPVYFYYEGRGTTQGQGTEVMYVVVQ